MNIYDLEKKYWTEVETIDSIFLFFWNQERALDTMLTRTKPRNVTNGCNVYDVSPMAWRIQHRTDGFPMNFIVKGSGFLLALFLEFLVKNTNEGKKIIRKLTFLIAYFKQLLYMVPSTIILSVALRSLLGFIWFLCW